MLGKEEMSPLGINAHAVQYPILQQLVDTGIDDLAKYRIVLCLRECARPVDVAYIAGSLGLHPLDLVSETLESLASVGIVVREQLDPPLYILNCHPALKTAVQKLFSPLAAKERECIFRALASASLAKARARARGHGGDVRE